MRGIGDFIDDEDAADRTGSQRVAAHNAALFVPALILAPEPGACSRLGEPWDSERPLRPPVVNTAHGSDSNNVVQAGIISGGSHLGGKQPKRRQETTVDHEPGEEGDYPIKWWYRTYC